MQWKYRTHRAGSKEPIEKTKDKHQIEKSTSKLRANDMYRIKRVYDILPCVWLVLLQRWSFPRFLCVTRGSLSNWIKVLHTISYSSFLSIYNLSLAQINPNGWIMLLNLAILSREIGFELEDNGIRAMYCIKRKWLDVGHAYISTISK